MAVNSFIKHGTRVILLLASPIICLIIVEGYLRWRQPLWLRGLLTESQFINMKQAEIFLVPGYQGKLFSRTGEFSHAVRINRDGFRDDRELEHPKPTGQRRLAFLGDSFTFGYGSDYQDTVPYLVEKRLNERQAIRYRSLNFGFRAGNCPRPQYLFFKNRLDAFAPDEIFWGIFLGNDLDEMTYFKVIQRDADELPSKLVVPGEWWRTKLKGLALWQCLRVPIKALLSPNLTSQERVKTTSHEVSENIPSIPDCYRDQMNEIIRMATVMDRESRTKNRRLAVVFFQGAAQPLVNAQSTPSVYGRIQLELLARLKDRNIMAVDLSQAFAGYTSDFVTNHLMYPSDGHLTPAGNRLMADYLLKVCWP